MPHDLGVNRRLPLILTFLLCTAAQPDWQWLSAELRAAEREIAAKRAALKALGEPMIGQTVPEFGLQHAMLLDAPPESPYVQLDLGESRAFETVAIVPAVVDFQSLTQSAYAFPPRYRLDASDDENFATFTPLKVQLHEDAAPYGVAPVIVRTPGIKARYLRLTVPTMARVEGRWTFALSEIMVLQGNRNIAIGAKVMHLKGTNLAPRWLAQNLTDGRTPLGPPMDRSSVPEYDALFSAIHDDVTEPWMSVDLGAEMPLDEVRLHPLHARQGADVPGFRFPQQFRIETAATADMKNATVIYETGGVDFSNPGNNPVTLPAHARRGRYVRVNMLKIQPAIRADFALSELEVYVGDKNVARGMTASSSGDRFREVMRPLSLLTDGHVSYGRLMELPQWLDQWELRQTLMRDIQDLEARSILLHAKAQQRAVWLAVIAAFILGALAITAIIRSRRQQAREQENLRNQLARDMHDEIGSNLAGIAVISELPLHDPEDWKEINRIAHETTDAMREVLWLVGARQESGIHLMEQLQRVAKRLLPHHEVAWKALPTDLPESWPVESRRQVFLFFKEALTNILRHARATQVELSAQTTSTTFELNIQDNGRGFDPTNATPGMGLSSLRDRAKKIGATFVLNSSPQGTTLTLRAPLAAKLRHSSF
jgi:signal transduction histidine kinase